MAQMIFAEHRLIDLNSLPVGFSGKVHLESLSGLQGGYRLNLSRS